MTEQEYINKIEEIHKAYQDKLNELVNEYASNHGGKIEGDLNPEQKDLIKDFVSLCEKLDNLGVTILYPMNQSTSNVYVMNTSDMGNIRISHASNVAHCVCFEGEKWVDIKNSYAIDKTVIPMELYETDDDRIYYESVNNS